MIMSIDQSLTASGVTIWQGGTLEGFTVIKSDPKQETILRIRYILSELRKLVKEFNVTTIVIESLPFGINSTSVRPLAALHMMIQDLCMTEHLLFAESHVTKVKKLATGKGTAKKVDMFNATNDDSPEFISLVLASGVKKTTGLYDLCDSYWIYKLFGKENYLRSKYYTELSDAKLIVPSEDLWVGVPDILWDDKMSELSWNDNLQTNTYKLPVETIKIGTLQRVNKKGYVIRPVNEFRDFNNVGIHCKGGSK